MHADGSPYRAAEYPLARSLLHAEVIVREESLYRRADGVVRRFLSSSAPVLDGQGRVVAGVTVFYDITEQREAEARTAVLTEATATLSASLDYDTTLARVAELAVPEFSDWCLVHMKEDDGSARAVAVAHRDPAKARTARDLLMRSHLNPDASGATAQVIRTGKPFLTDNISEAELATTARTPEHLAFLKSLGLRSAFLLPLTARGQILGAISFTMGESGRRFDPVDRPSIEELVRRASMAVDNARLYAQAQAAIRARDEFLAMASHDLRSPLASLRLQTHLLQEKRLDGDRTTETTLIKGIDRASARIIAMLDNLLDVSRIHAGRISLELEDIDLADLARDALERQQELLERAGCSWSVNAPQPVVGHWDRLRLEQVLMNLVSNAAKYGAGHAVEVSVQSAPGAGILRVRDGGIGISAEDCAKLFQPFERVGNKAASRGTGLGLWIVRTIVEAMGGSVRVFSEPGHGATFEVALPTRPPEGVTEAAKPKQA